MNERLKRGDVVHTVYAMNGEVRLGDRCEVILVDGLYVQLFVYGHGGWNRTERFLANGEKGLHNTEVVLQPAYGPTLPSTWEKSVRVRRS